MIVRPSGTEPKIKLYLNAVGGSREEATALETRLVDEGTALLGF